MPSKGEADVQAQDGAGCHSPVSEDGPELLFASGLSTCGRTHPEDRNTLESPTSCGQLGEMQHYARNGAHRLSS